MRCSLFTWSSFSLTGRKSHPLGRGALVRDEPRPFRSEPSWNFFTLPKDNQTLQPPTIFRRSGRTPRPPSSRLYESLTLLTAILRSMRPRFLVIVAASERKTCGDHGASLTRIFLEPSGLRDTTSRVPQQRALLPQP